MTERINPFYECPHCFKKLTTEARLERHNCEKKKRFTFMQTMKGKSAFYCYREWMRAQGRSARDIDIFMNSKYYNSIIKFVKFCNKVGIPDRKHYISYMVEKGIMPSQWDEVSVYETYIQHFDSSKTPLEMASITVDTIYDLSEIFECELNEVFEHMESSDIMRLVAARKLSPWILLFSESFKTHLRCDTTAEQKILIGSVIDHKHWAGKFKDDPKSVAAMKKIVSELSF